MPEQRGSGSNERASDRYPLLLFVVFVVFAAALGISPWYRQDWLLENLLVIVALSLFAWTYRRWLGFLRGSAGETRYSFSP